MFPPPWDRDPRVPDLSPYLDPPNRHRPTHSHRLCHDSYGMHDWRKSKPTHNKMPKPTRFSELDTPSNSNPYPSEWYDSHDLSTDEDFSEHHLPRFLSLRRRARSPKLRKACVKLPTSTVDELRYDEILIIPAPTHLHIRIDTPYARGDEVIHAAVDGGARFDEVVKQIAATYISSKIRPSEVRAYVRQRGRWDEPGSSARIEDLRDRGEVWRDGSRELDVKIQAGDDSYGSSEGFYVGRRGPRGRRDKAFSDGVEQAYESRSESRIRRLARA